MRAGGGGGRLRHGRRQGRRPAAATAAAAAVGGQVVHKMAAVAVPDFIIARKDVHVQEGPEGIIGSGALGVVRKGEFRGEPCALKGLHLLRTRSASRARVWARKQEGSEARTSESPHSSRQGHGRCG